MELKGKRVLFLGSSVTYGAKSGGVSFAEITAEMCGFECVKYAVSGTTLADVSERSYVSRLKTVDTEQHFDLFVCQLSTNDAGKLPDFIGTEAAMRFIIEYIREKFGCRIMFYTSARTFESPRYEELVGIMYRLQKEYGFDVLDLWNDPEMNSSAITEEQLARYMKDKAHPTYEGYAEWWAPKFVEFYNNL